MNQSVKQTIYVAAAIKDDQGRVLLLQRSKRDNFLPGYFELPGGRSEMGETPERALGRKLKQETTIEPKQLRYYGSISGVDHSGPYIRMLFETAYALSSDNIISGKSHDDVLWIDKSDIESIKITADSKTLLTKYQGETIKLEKNDVKNTTLTIYTDGGSRGNPGPSASGFVIYDDKQTLLKAGGEYIGVTTNNQAEYTAVVLALKAASEFADQSSTITFNIDSLLVVNQMNGVYKIKNRDLWPLNQQIHELTKNFKRVTFNHVYREHNSEADAQVNKLLDANT